MAQEICTLKTTPNHTWQLSTMDRETKAKRRELEGLLQTKELAERLERRKPPKLPQDFICPICKQLTLNRRQWANVGKLFICKSCLQTCQAYVDYKPIPKTIDWIGECKQLKGLEICNCRICTLKRVRESLAGGLKRLKLRLTSLDGSEITEERTVDTLPQVKEVIETFLAKVNEVLKG